QAALRRGDRQHGRRGPGLGRREADADLVRGQQEGRDREALRRRAELRGTAPVDREAAGRELASFPRPRTTKKSPASRGFFVGARCAQSLRKSSWQALQLGPALRKASFSLSRSPVLEAAASFCTSPVIRS